MAAQIDTDGVGDELCPLTRRGAVSIDICCAVSDHVALVQLAFLGAGGAVIVVGDPVDAAGESKIDFEAPFTVALAEVKAVAVDFPVPLFRTRAGVAVDDNPALVCQPGLKLGFGGMLGGFDPLAIRQSSGDAPIFRKS